jgi:hypothetical protein
MLRSASRRFAPIRRAPTAALLMHILAAVAQFERGARLVRVQSLGNGEKPYAQRLQLLDAINAVNHGDARITAVAFFEGRALREKSRGSGRPLAELTR